MATQQERTDATKALLLDTFRSTAIELGYAATTTQLLSDRTGLSKGAIYHHFSSKAELMSALYAREAKLVFKRALETASLERSCLLRLKSLYNAWIHEVLTPEISKILFDIGPSAIGAKRAKDIEDEVTLVHIKDILRDAQSSGEIKPVDIDVLAALLNALVGEAAMYRLRTGMDTTPMVETAVDSILLAYRPR